ncbi:MAG: hypothetical protein WCA84_01505 [Ignavibacteriaceae bacterium]
MKNLISFLLLFLSFIGCSGSASMQIVKKPNTKIDLASPTVVLTDKTENTQDMTFVDMLATKLLGMGMNLMDRSTLQAMLKEKGVNWDQVISGQQYFKIGENSHIKTIIVVNSIMNGSMVIRASCRVIEASTGTLLMSMTITNPSMNEGYVGNESIPDIISEWANAITSDEDYSGSK